MENQIVGAILIGTVMMLLLVAFLIVFVVQAYKWKKKYVETEKLLNETDNNLDFKLRLINELKEDEITNTKLINHFRSQLPLNPVIQSIEYYKERKNIQVHCFITSLGIAVTSDIDQINYKIRLIAELGEPTDTIAEDLVKELIEDTTPVGLDGVLEDKILEIIGSLRYIISPNTISVKNAKILIENRNRICKGQTVNLYLEDQQWDALIKMVAFEESGTNM